MFKPLRVALLAALLGGCSSIETHVDGWPQDMKVSVHKAGFWEIQRMCWRDMPTWRKLVGSICPTVAYVNLDTNTCDIYSLDGQATEHELEHCKGGDHDGTLQRYYDTWKHSTKRKNNGPAAKEPI